MTGSAHFDIGVRKWSIKAAHWHEDSRVGRQFQLQVRWKCTRSATEAVVPHQRLALGEITSWQHFDLTLGRGKKAGQATADALQAATYLSSNNIQKKKKVNVQLGFADSHTQKGGRGCWCPGWGHYLISFYLTSMQHKQLFLGELHRSRGGATPVICALRMLIRPRAALGTVYSAAHIQAN